MDIYFSCPKSYSNRARGTHQTIENQSKQTSVEAKTQKIPINEEKPAQEEK